VFQKIHLRSLLKICCASLPIPFSCQSVSHPWYILMVPICADFEVDNFHLDLHDVWEPASAISGLQSKLSASVVFLVRGLWIVVGHFGGQQRRPRSPDPACRRTSASIPAADQSGLPTVGQGDPASLRGRRRILLRWPRPASHAEARVGAHGACLPGLGRGRRSQCG